MCCETFLLFPSLIGSGLFSAYPSVYNLVMPSFLFVTLSFASMLLPPGDLGQRFDIVLAILVLVCFETP